MFWCEFDSVFLLLEGFHKVLFVCGVLVFSRFYKVWGFDCGICVVISFSYRGQTFFFVI